MGIHGIFKEIGPGQRIALAKVAADHYIAHNRPFRLAIDISIWLFQIQAGKGGSNPALRTFYYRLLRLLSLGIHPLFIFDGPNKPLFKRNKRVGGPGVRVANVPEFLAKQLLQHFGFPMHVAPGEAEAECALLQREGIVDAVLSEDVDTIMFGSDVTFKNWTSESTSKSPTHVNLYRAEETKATSGLDSQGMILVALMSGGDYIPEGIPGCGPKVACDAARAGFGAGLCALGRKDSAGLKAWKKKLQHEIRTNESRFFTRKSSVLTIPEDFPNAEVMRYYTNPCVSTQDKLQKLRDSLKWDQKIDYAALRTFAADAFDWRCIGGAKKFIKNLAPAILVRDLRLRAERNDQSDDSDHASVKAIHGKRNHNTTDGILEYRISFTPAELVPIDLSIEEEDDEHTHPANDSDAESDDVSSSARPIDSTEAAAPASLRKRVFKPFDPDAPEKLWVMSIILQLGCPLLVEDYEASLNDPRAFLKARNKAKGTAKGGRSKKPPESPQSNKLDAYVKIIKKTVTSNRDALQEIQMGKNLSLSQPIRNEQEEIPGVAVFKLPSSQIPAANLANSKNTGKNHTQNAKPPTLLQRTPPRKKRPVPAFDSPVLTQRTIEDSLTASARRIEANRNREPIDLTLSSPAPPDTPTRRSTPPQPKQRPPSIHDTQGDVCFRELPNTVTKRRKRVDYQRTQSAPVYSNAFDDDEDDEGGSLLRAGSSNPSTERTPSRALYPTFGTGIDYIDIDSPRSPKSDGGLPSPCAFIRPRSAVDRAAPVDQRSGSSGDLAGFCGDHMPARHIPSLEGPSVQTCVPTIAISGKDHVKPQTLDLTEEMPMCNPLPKHLEMPHTTVQASKAAAEPDHHSRPHERSIPTLKQNTAVKKLIQLRPSLAGTWKEVDIDAVSMLDLTENSSLRDIGDNAMRTDRVGKITGSGGPVTANIRGRKKAAEGPPSRKHGGGGGWRKSAVEVMDLTGE